MLQGTIHLLTRSCTTWVAITTKAPHVHVQRQTTTMVTVTLTDSSDPLWATIAELVNVTTSRKVGVLGYSASPIPTSSIRISPWEAQQLIMRNESMMSGKLLLNTMILRYQRNQQTHVHRQRHHRQRHHRQRHHRQRHH